jgi:drug/metabolite transporter (DMT)-like permease
MKPNHNGSFLKALLAVILWGGSFVATKVALIYVTPIVLVWIRFGMGVIVLGVAVAVTHSFFLPQKDEWPYFFLLGFLGITLHQWLQSTGLVTSQATTTAWIVASMPMFIAILGVLFLKEKLARIQVMGIFISAIGVLLVVTKGDLTLLTGFNPSAKGDLLILLSAPNWAIFTILSMRGLRKYPAMAMIFLVVLIGWIFSSVPFIIQKGYIELFAIPWKAWYALAFLGIFCSGIAYVFWYSAMKELPVAKTGAFLYIEPIVTVIVAAILLDEKMIPSIFFGGGMILLGVWLVNRKS